MKKTIVLFVSLCLIVIHSMGQMQGSNLPRFVRWLDNSQFVINTKINNEKIAKDYVYNLTTKQYTLAPAASDSSDKNAFVKNANIYFKENFRASKI